MANTGLIPEGLNQRKAKRASIIIHIIMILLLLIPILHSKEEDPPRFKEVITIDFKDTFEKKIEKEIEISEKAGAERSSAEEGSPPKTEDPTPVEEVQETTPDPEPVEETPEAVEEPEEDTQEEDTAVTPEEKDTEPKASAAEAAAAKARAAAEAAKAGSGNGSGGSGSGNGKSNTPGEGKQGTSDRGNSDTDGKADAGAGVDFDGIGKLQRSVARRVFPKDLSKSGKVEFNICIDRSGTVVYAKYNRSKSTLTDRSAISDALSAMKKTTFARDSSAPGKECGQWTINFTALDN